MAVRLGKVQLIDWPTGPQLVAVTIRRGSTVSVTVTAWAVLKVPVRSEERRVGKEWRPGGTAEGWKEMTRLRRAALGIVRDFVSVAVWPPLSAVAASAVLATLPAAVAGATW